MLKRASLALATLVAVAVFPACATSNTPQVGTTSTTGGGTGGDASGPGGTGGDDPGTGGAGQGGSGGGESAKCGDGKVAVDESCDDGNETSGDGCTDTCDFEVGWKCENEPSVCLPICGDGLLIGGEICDDAAKKNGDGCSDACVLELGYTCTGEPSVCATTCGDGVIAGKEACDDTNAAPGDGCSDACVVEAGFECVMMPSACTSICGDGIVAGKESCDDDNTAPGDGCDDLCGVEQYYTCMGAPSVCSTPCGDGIIAGSEVCDDGNVVDKDGCSAGCIPETGYVCMGLPSMCATVCGDNVIAGVEICDDGNNAGGDGCNFACKVEPGFTCVNNPSVCTTTCADGYPAGKETCDDGNMVNGDGCDSTCKAEKGYVCSNIPSVCGTVCGDGVIGGLEECDDGNTVGNDGCSPLCNKQQGFNCAGEPSVCNSVCGDGIVVGTETCDDGNLTNGDCCSSVCGAEAGCEIEPNGTSVEANDFAAIAVTNQIKGFINPAGDSDYYKITVPSQMNALGVITADTVDGFVSSSCANNTQNSLINLYDAMGAAIGTDNDSGPGLCALLTKSGLAAGDYYVEVKGGAANLTFDYVVDVVVTMVVCGDGMIGPGEQCDDGNVAVGDGCDNLCKIETHAEIEPNNTPAQALANGFFITPGLYSGAIGVVGDLDYFAINIVKAVDIKIETFDSTGPNSCVTIDTKVELFASNGTTVLASDDDDGPNLCSIIDPAVASDAGARHLLPGTYYIRVHHYNDTATLSGYMTLVTFTAVCGDGVKQGYEACDGGPTCDPNTCNKIPVCGDTVIDIGETCDDGNTTSSDGCSAACVIEAGFVCTGTPSMCVFMCGNGMLNGTEQCDDGNTISGDGCSSTCSTELNYLCSGTPSVCVLVETNCNDGTDNDGDGMIDCADSNCAAGCALTTPCSAGQTLRVYNSPGLPKAIPDPGTATLNISVPDNVTVLRAATRLSITHTWDADLDLSLKSPAGPTIDLSSDNGGSSDNYTNTMFDSTCGTNITSGSAPFSGCFKPEQALTAFDNQSATGTWTLTCADDTSIDSGTVTAWSLVLCTTP